MRFSNNANSLRAFPSLAQSKTIWPPDLRVFSYRGYSIYFRNLPDRVRIERVLPPGLEFTKQSFD